MLSCISDQITNLNPSNGSVIVDFKGSINATTITCDVVNTTGNQINTEWSVTNFRELSNFRMLSDITAPEIFLLSGDPIPGTVPNQTYRNRLTVLVLSNDLDQVTIFCGSSAFPTLAHVSFRVYRKYRSLSYLNNHGSIYVR